MQWLFFISIVVAMIGGVTAVIDMAMNGSQYAGWAPYGLTMAAIGGFLAWLSGIRIWQWQWQQ